MAAGLPYADWKATLAGEDITDRLKPRLLGLTLNEKRGGEADQLDITLDDSDGKLSLPPTGVTLSLQMGWKRGANLPIGLIDKGDFKIDERSWEGPPDKIVLRARSADLTGNFRIRRERSFVGQTVQAVIGLLAAENGLTAKIDPDLAAEIIPALGHGAKSDAALLQELGHRFDAIATVKARNLIFSAAGKGVTTSGLIIPPLTIDRSQCGQARFEEADRGQYGGVEAKWHDLATGTQKTALAGADNPPPKRLRKIYATEADAIRAAKSELSRMKRGKARLTFPLALGRPDLYPDRPIEVTGFKAEINALKWLVAETSHSMDGRGGLMTRLQLEAG
ncbi:MAG: phage late control D family protein [Asticcacaulis sp.]|uniref:phage late control D family protein n=1 Tax=Asticcacaulis sp. TaxID=1872648 RepID=UPI003F7C3730